MKHCPEPIHIAFGVNNSYASYIAVTIKSIMENIPGCDIHVHVLTDRISKSNRERLEETVGGSGRVKLRIYVVDDSLLKGLKTGTWTIYTWYRVLLPGILPKEVKRVLYLDADTLVVSDLRELFSMNMTGKSIAAPLDIQSFSDWAFERCGYEKEKKYVCAGVLLMNLEYWRRHETAKQLIDWADKNRDRIFYPDQDAVNYICRDTKILLPFRYNIFKFYLTGDLHKVPELFADIRDCAYNPAIVHYAGYYPWLKFFDTHPMQDEWERYNNMLPHPVGRACLPKRWLHVKMILWKLLHRPFKKQTRLTVEDVKRRLSEYDS